MTPPACRARGDDPPIFPVLLLLPLLPVRAGLYLASRSGAEACDLPQAAAPAAPDTRAPSTAGAITVARIDPRLTITLGVATALSALAALAGAFYTRLRSDRALEHPRRAQIRDFVTVHPGVEMSAVARELAIPWTRTRHHVRKLEEFGMLRVVRAHGRTALFVGGEPAAAAEEAILRRQAAGRVHALLREAGPLDQAAIATRLGLSQSRTSYLLRTLQQARLVEAGRHGRRIQYVPAPAVPPLPRPG